MNKHFLLRLATLLAFSVCAAGVSAQTKLPIKQLSAGMYVIQAEVASSDAEREQGLMLRTKMAGNEGMVFDFHAPAGVCMWMKNTLIPLSVAFIDRDGVIVNIEDMAPESLDSHCAKRTVQYALEMNLGWFKQKNIKPGTKIEGLPLAR
ncbi:MULTISPECIES: DUF192 domain-containing protein [unclassified Undibacterium]|uniref:DUF192 domain-containing protein n=1 Tax=unclassified Undibacterium TaxID=2630295 RepID=UPI002AC94730|nr:MULTISPECIES: DUF192 domain-containing protein [unclassified Undibacterium]MEB0140982.1 DUF192 domain-containing protein [Undibacterium sp. CCC2.1]MEB0173460.1 DUF192 domain-containing protein [Undibacterium sp. CCC1.1]MEB0177194.1 DUF192 domain-containing protein [Undibacterium sp. CCC3.4]MEB0216459.1 DUF192 domain-containing protein [Undibacterium sp. 5I2]WPX42045.1 DUF192 domain-containing protein [Undibacterium sp. CCC3.4]